MRVVLWSGIVLLALLGVASSAGRAVLLFDPQNATVLGIQRDFLLKVRPLEDFPIWMAEFERVNAHWANSRAMVFAHVLSGALFLALAPLQFSSRIRASHPALHRRSGRFLAICAAVTGLTALYLGIFVPFGDMLETTSVVAFGLVFLISIALAVRAIRRGDQARHRRWMIRAFSIGLGVSVIRVLGAPVGALFAYPIPETIGITFWTGWLISLGVGELWIRRQPLFFLRARA